MTRAAAWRPRAAAFGNAAVLLALAAFAFFCLRLHGGWPAWSAPDAARAWAAALAAAVYAGACCAFWLQRRRTARMQSAVPASGARTMLVAYASQTGFAERIARQTVDTLRAAGGSAQAVPLAQLGSDALAAAERVLFVVSTTGEGDAPDAAAGFVRDAIGATPSLTRLRYGLLALGDNEYANFCAFGRRLDAWLLQRGAQPLFDRIEVDAGDEGALRHWQHHLGLLVGNTDVPDWSAPEYARWRLVERRVVNPGSAGEPCHHLVLAPPAAQAPTWRAGDIAEIGPRNARAAVEAVLAQTGFDGATLVDGDRGRESLAERLARSRLPAAGAPVFASAQALAASVHALPHREYSIASLPADGAIHLLVREFRRSDGHLGVGSGWLTQGARVGDEIALRIRANANFHAPDPKRPLILIGNGTGIAGLRALLKERAAAGRTRNWLLFGERHAASDFHYREDILAWHASGAIERLDLAFSRDQGERLYVQQRLRDAGAAVREWVAAGAAVYVCGSLAGMAPGVHAALVESLGENEVEGLLAQGRYRRDVY